MIYYKSLYDTLYGGSGVYILRWKRRVLYVGCSKNIRKRVMCHSRMRFSSVEVIKCGKSKMFSIERETISKLNPKLNRNVILSTGRIVLPKQTAMEIVKLHSKMAKSSIHTYSINQIAQMATFKGIAVIKRQFKIK